MNDTSIKATLSEAITKAVPEGSNPASVVAKILNIGKESAYRRLRGSINFSFKEIATLANHLGISLDILFGLIQQEDALFKLRLLNEGHSIDIYMSKLAEYTSILHNITSTSNNVVFRLAQNSLSLYNIFRHPTLSKFYLFKWLRQTQPSYVNLKFADFELPNQFREIQDAYISEMQKISHFILILDPNIYSSSIKDIDYFYKVNLVTNQELNLLKQDLLSSIHNLETMATSGFSAKGARIEMFLSSIDIETSYIHIESESQHYSEFLIFSIFSLDTKNMTLSQTQKDWIDSLKRYSTSITQCGEIQRYNFFNKQREMVERKWP